MTTTSPFSKFNGLLLGGLMAVGSLTAAGLGSAPTAEATCISAFGWSSKPSQCSSTIASVAIGLGPSTQAFADGFLGAAISIGAGINASVVSGSALNFAVAVGGKFGQAAAGGIGSVAMTIGWDPVGLGRAYAGWPAPGLNLFNVAVNAFGRTNSPVEAFDGVGNLAVSLLGGERVNATGNFNTALMVGGRSSGGWAQARGTLNNVTNLFGKNTRADTVPNSTATAAFTLFGKNNNVTAGPGPLAVAGQIGQTGKTVTKVGPGIHINGLVIGGAASTPAPSATTGKRASRPATVRTIKARPSAATRGRQG